MENDLEDLVLLYEDGKYSYGIIKGSALKIDRIGFAKKGKGIIEKNLLQKNIVISFQSEKEKEEILKVIPAGFYATIKGKEIIIEFEKEEISAPLYVNKDNYCEKIESKTIQATLKSPELTKAIKDLRANIYLIKSKYQPENCIDKYDASSRISRYFLWLIKTGQAEAIDEDGNISDEEYMHIITSSFDRTSFRIRYNGKAYYIHIGDTDSWSYYESYDGLEKKFQEYIEKLKEDGEYFLPETKIPRYQAPKVGTKIIKFDKDKYIVADRKKVYAKLSGVPIFEDSFILTDDKSIVYGLGEQEMFSDMLHTKVKDSRHIETEVFIGYNDNQIMFIHDSGESFNRRLLSSESFQRFEREDAERPVTMFSTGDTVGFIDGKKVRLSNERGEISTFEIEEDIQNIDIQNGYILINGNIVCCGAIYEETSWSKKIAPFCKKINNPKTIEMFMQDSNKIQQSSFIENENGCFFIKGLKEEERLRLYKENGFSGLYKKLETIIIARQEAQREKERKIEEARNKTNEYLEGKTLSLCHLRKYSSYRGKIIEADNVEFVENDNAVVLFEAQEKGWGYGPVYEAGIINVTEAKKRTKGGKLHLDVPEDVMGIIIGRRGSNINAVTSILREKGIDLSKIILHPKSREEIKITLESIDKAIKEQRAKSHED